MHCVNSSPFGPAKALWPPLAILVPLALLVLLLSGPALAAPLAAGAPQTLQLDTEKSLVLDFDQDIARISVAAPEVAEVLVLSPRQVYVTGKASGSTTLTVWGANGSIQAVYEVAVSPDLTNLKQMLHQVLPQEQGIQVLSAGDKITLAGQVSSTANLATALALAETAVAEPDQVVNLMSVGGVQQVMLEVRVAEMSRSVTKRLGFNFAFSEGSSLAYTFLNNLTSLDGADILLTDSVAALFSTTMGAFTLTSFLDALKAKGLVKILAEPNLICLSGETANFLAGGEIPVPVPSGLGSLAIEYKPFGVWLEFTPTVLAEDKISLKVNPEVSELNYDQGVNIESIVVPALNTSRASTTIELKDGQSFAIAGLLKNNLRENSAKFPVLGDLPILGALFRSNDYLKEQSELIIIVTPHLAKPMDAAHQALPTDGFQEPNDLEFYLFGLLESQGLGLESSPATTAAPAPVRGADNGFDGAFGYAMPN